MGQEHDGESRPGQRNNKGNRPDPGPLAQRLFQARMSAGLSRAEAATRANIADNSIYRYEKGRNVPRPEILAKLARVYGRSVEWLRGDPETEVGPSWNLSAGPVTGQEISVQVVGIPVIAAVAGAGMFVYEETARDWQPYRQDRLVRAGMDEATSKLVEVRGDSMAPLIPSGEVVMVDVSQRSLWDGRIFLMSVDNEGIVVRRVFQEGKTWLVCGDHPGWRPRIFQETWTVHGQVRAVDILCG